MQSSDAALTSRSRTWFLSLTWALVLIAALQAWRIAWTSDDAFISFRYAYNLIRGYGLVYNRGEYVEGFTNFLWTLWIALGLRLGIAAEIWTNFWSIATYAGSIGLLAWYSWREQPVAASGARLVYLPVAAIAGALLPDWISFATSGLETAPFTFFVLAGFVALTTSAPLPRRYLLSALLFAAAAMTRPDGVLLAFVAGLYVIWRAPRQTARFAVPFLLVWVPFMAFRYWYYGDIFPNTYYAKSAYLTWWSQGAAYTQSYFKRYWALAIFPACGPIFLWLNRKRINPAPPTVLAAAMAAAYILYVTRTGGDFMYARFLIPATPFLLILTERSVRQWAIFFKGQGSYVLAFLTLLIAAAVRFTPSPLEGVPAFSYYGIVDERLAYSPRAVNSMETRNRLFDPVLHDLPLSVAFIGGQARSMYRLDIPLAVEAATGLTDHFIAHQQITERGRVGHEKSPTLAYLQSRKVDFAWPPVEVGKLSLQPSDPPLPNRFYEYRGLHLQIIVLNPATRTALEKRGVRYVENWIPPAE